MMEKYMFGIYTAAALLRPYRELSRRIRPFLSIFLQQTP
jgi:hypothetical protein